MVSALDSGASGPGSSPGRGHYVVFLGKTLYSHSASLHPGVYTGKLNAGGNPAMDQHPIQGNRDKLRPGGPHWPVCRLYLTFLQPSLQHRRALLARHAIFPGGRLCDESKRREPLFVRLSLLCLPWSLEERP